MSDINVPQTQPSLWKERIFAFAIGAFFAALGIGGSWYYASGSAEPYYASLPPVEVARKESPKLSVQWEGKPIQNLCVAKVGLWNGGQSAIRQWDFPTSDPLRIVAGRNVQLLSIEPTNASRSSLSFDTKISNAPIPSIQLALKNNDSLNADDGVAYKILYEGPCDAANFTVLGQVNSSKHNFVKTKPNLPEKKNTLRLGLALMAFLMGMNVFETLLSQTKWNTRRTRRAASLAIIATLSLITISVAAMFITEFLHWKEVPPTWF